MDTYVFKKQVEESIHALLALAGNMVSNKLSNDCRFILTEIKYTSENLHAHRKIRKRENDRKTPVSIENILSIVNNLYDEIYDLNFQVYKATKKCTVIEISYFPKSSLEQDYRQKISGNPPMIHCKVAMPPWLSDNKEKFDINWEHQDLLTQMLLLWQRIKLKTNVRHKQ